MIPDPLQTIPERDTMEATRPDVALLTVPVDYMMKRRELLLIELAYIEDVLGLPRTKEPRKR